MGRSARVFGDAALRRMRRYPWPGNVRELRNAIERAVLLSEGERVDEVDLDGGAGGAPAPAEVVPRWDTQEWTLERVEQRLVRSALEHCDWVQKDAASLLGVSRRKLNYMIRRIGITHPSWRRNRGQGDAEDGP